MAALAFLTWNLAFDHALAAAAAEYVDVATAAANGSGPYVNIDDWMGPGVHRGLWTATVAAAVVFAAGLSTASYAAARRRSQDPSGN